MIYEYMLSDLIREAAKEVLFLVAGPLRTVFNVRPLRTVFNVRKKVPMATKPRGGQKP